MILLAVALGGAVGAPARFLADRYVSYRVPSDFPWGTFLINLSGSLLLGLLTGLDVHGHLAPAMKALFATGFCGAYTTFSTWNFETARLLQDGKISRAIANALASLVLGLCAAGVGLAIGLSA
jgi:CrcB protein